MIYLALYWMRFMLSSVSDKSPRKYEYWNILCRSKGKSIPTNAPSMSSRQPETRRPRPIARYRFQFAKITAKHYENAGQSKTLDGLNASPNSSKSAGSWSRRGARSLSKTSDCLSRSRLPNSAPTTTRRRVTDHSWITIRSPPSPWNRRSDFHPIESARLIS